MAEVVALQQATQSSDAAARRWDRAFGVLGVDEFLNRVDPEVAWDQLTRRVGSRQWISRTLKSDDPDPLAVRVLQQAHVDWVSEMGEGERTYFRAHDPDYAKDPFDGSAGPYGAILRRTPEGGFSGVTSWFARDLLPERSAVEAPGGPHLAWGMWDGWEAEQRGESVGKSGSVVVRSLKSDQVLGRVGDMAPAGEVLIARDSVIVQRLMDGEFPIVPQSMRVEGEKEAEFGYDPQQPRDERGRWTEVGATLRDGTWEVDRDEELDIPVGSGVGKLIEDRYGEEEWRSQEHRRLVGRARRIQQMILSPGYRDAVSEWSGKPLKEASYQEIYDATVAYLLDRPEEAAVSTDVAAWEEGAFVPGAWEGMRGIVSATLKSKSPDPDGVELLRQYYEMTQEVLREGGAKKVRVFRSSDQRTAEEGNHAAQYGLLRGGTGAESGVTSWTTNDQNATGWGRHFHEQEVPVERVLMREGMIGGELLVMDSVALADRLKREKFPISDGRKYGRQTVSAAGVGEEELGYNPNQPRDERGRWTSAGGRWGESFVGEYGREMLMPPASEDPSKISVREAVDAEAVRIYEHQWRGRDGEMYRSEVDSTTESDEGGVVDVSGTLRRRVGDRWALVGGFVRTMYPDQKTIEHESFHVDYYMQGKGIGSEFVRRSMEAAAAEGYEKVNTLALSGPTSNGVYTWLRQGFKLDDGFDADGSFGRALRQRMYREMDPDKADEIVYRIEGSKTPEADLLKLPGARRLLGDGPSRITAYLTKSLKPEPAAGRRALAASAGIGGVDWDWVAEEWLEPVEGEGEASASASVAPEAFSGMDEWGFACRSEACAPPPVGTGGSEPGGGLAARRGAVQRRVAAADASGPRVMVDDVLGEGVDAKERVRLADKLVKQVYEMDLGGGYQSKVLHVTGVTHGYLRVKGEIIGPRGWNVGEWTRVMYGAEPPWRPHPYVEHELFTLGVAHQNKGVGGRFVARSMKNAADAGFDEVKMTAASGSTMNGVLVWPKMGFELDDPITWESDWADAVADRLTEAGFERDAIDFRNGEISFNTVADLAAYPDKVWGRSDGNDIEFSMSRDISLLREERVAMAAAAFGSADEMFLAWWRWALDAQEDEWDGWAVVASGFDPRQPRDDRGRWAAVGGLSGSAKLALVREIVKLAQAAERERSNGIPEADRRDTRKLERSGFEDLFQDDTWDEMLWHGMGEVELTSGEAWGLLTQSVHTRVWVSKALKDAQPNQLAVAALKGVHAEWRAEMERKGKEKVKLVRLVRGDDPFDAAHSPYGQGDLLRDEQSRKSGVTSWFMMDGSGAKANKYAAQMGGGLDILRDMVVGAAKRKETTYMGDRIVVRDVPVEQVIGRIGDMAWQGEVLVAHDKETVQRLMGDERPIVKREGLTAGGVSAVTVLEFFDPSQPRDERGRWTSAGGAGRVSAESVPVAGAEPLDVDLPALAEIRGHRWMFDTPMTFVETKLLQREVQRAPFAVRLDSGRLSVMAENGDWTLRNAHDGEYVSGYDEKGVWYMEQREAYDKAVDIIDKDAVHGFVDAEIVVGRKRWRSSAADYYGDSKITLKDSVKDRAYFTPDDSLDRANIPIPVRGEIRKGHATWNVDSGGRYVETQVPGPVPASEWAAVTVPDGDTLNEFAWALAEAPGVDPDELRVTIGGYSWQTDSIEFEGTLREAMERYPE